jgi:hypothetical protein
MQHNKFKKKKKLLSAGASAEGEGRFKGLLAVS